MRIASWACSSWKARLASRQILLQLCRRRRYCQSQPRRARAGGSLGATAKIPAASRRRREGTGPGQCFAFSRTQTTHIGDVSLSLYAKRLLSEHRPLITTEQHSDQIAGDGWLDCNNAGLCLRQARSIKHMGDLATMFFFLPSFVSLFLSAPWITPRLRPALLPYFQNHPHVPLSARDKKKPHFISACASFRAH